MLRILLVGQHYGRPVSGMGNYVTQLINTLSAYGTRVSLVTDSTESSLPDLDLEHRIQVKGEWWDVTPYRWVSVARNAGKALQEVVSPGQYDLVHLCDARFAYFLTSLPVPVVGTTHDYFGIVASPWPWHYRSQYPDWLGRWWYYNFMHQVERRSFPKLGRLITFSEHIRDMLVRHYALNPATVDVIYPGIPAPQPLTASPGELAAGLEGSPRIVFIGGNFYGKGLPLVVRAVGRLVPQFPDLNLTVIGQSRLQAQIERLSRKVGAASHVRFLGWRPNPVTRMLLAQATVFAMPSVYEGWGMVYAEAMLEGVPVIGTTAGGVPELIKDGINGFVVDPDDVEALTERFRILFTDQALRNKFIANGRATAAQYTVERMVNATVKSYEATMSAWPRVQAAP